MLFFNYFTHSLKNVAKCFILLFLFLFGSFSYAADDGDWSLQRQIQLQQNREDYARRVYGSARHTYDTVDPVSSKTKTIVKSVVVEDVPSKARLGKSLLQRAKAFKGGLAGVLGGAAVTALIEAVGWVMEDGTFVKYKTSDDVSGTDIEVQGVKGPTTGAACNSYVSLIQKNNSSYKYNFISVSLPVLVSPNFYKFDCAYEVNYAPSDPKSQPVKTKVVGIAKDILEPQKKKVPITDADVGGIASGDYKDPVDPKYDINTKHYDDVVADAYQHDPKGIGNDLANEMDDRIKNAPPTSDGKPAPKGDPRYSQPPKDDEKTNDRSWGDDANKADGDTTPKTDSTTGEPTGGQSISLQFPVFCEWAHTMCKWYDDWKLSDKTYKDHLKKVEDHQADEKTFWLKVKEFFNFFTEPPQSPDDEDTEVDIDDTEVEKPELNISIGDSQCPTYQMDFDMGFMVVPIDLSPVYLCQIAEGVRAFFIALGFYLASLIVGRRVQ